MTDEQNWCILAYLDKATVGVEELSLKMSILADINNTGLGFIL